MARPQLLLDADLLYPDRKQEVPVPDVHEVATSEARDLLKDRFKGRRVYVSKESTIYYEEGNARRFVLPDVYVVKGVSARMRRVSFRMWEERVPCFVLEVASPETVGNDSGLKKALYERLGIAEYAQFDPHGGLIPGRLRLWRLSAEGVYVLVAPVSGTRRRSRELGLELGVVRGNLRFYAPGARAPLPSRTERIVRERARAEQERVRAEQERERAEQERVRAEQLGQELARVQAELARLREQGRAP